MLIAEIPSPLSRTWHLSWLPWAVGFKIWKQKPFSCLWSRPQLSQICPCWSKTTAWLLKHSKRCSVTGCNSPLASTKSFNLCVTFVPLRGLAPPPQITALPPCSAFEEWGDGGRYIRLHWRIDASAFDSLSDFKKGSWAAVLSHLSWTFQRSIVICSMSRICHQTWLTRGK